MPGSIELTEAALRDKGLGAAAIILNGSGQVLLVKHTYGRLNWELPGGMVERGEGPEAAVLREVREETGLDVELKNLAGYYYEPAEDRFHFVFRCETSGVVLPMPSSSEISECRYWSVDDLPRPISDFTVRRIQDALHGPAFPLPRLVPSREWLE